MKRKPFYSVRNGLDQEVFWTTSLREAREDAAKRRENAPASYVATYGDYYVARLVRVADTKHNV